MICARRAERWCCLRNCAASLCSSAVIRATRGLLSKMVAAIDASTPIVYTIVHHITLLETLGARPLQSQATSRSAEGDSLLPGRGACASGGCNSRFPLFLLLFGVGKRTLQQPCHLGEEIGKYTTNT